MANPMLMRALDEVRRFLMPSRGIIMWSGTAADIPTGWALCDSTRHTGPDRPFHPRGGKNLSARRNRRRSNGYPQRHCWKRQDGP